MITLRDYQIDISDRGSSILKQYGFVYLAMQVRTGKTLTSIACCEKVLKEGRVLFLTKKKAISGIEKDIEDYGTSLNVRVTNYESIHRLPKVNWDFLVLDEAHCLGAFPKPSKRALDIAKLIYWNKPIHVVLLSGTPTPESYSQIYHQVYGIPGNPFRGYKNFYMFARDHVSMKSKKINGYDVKDYSDGNKSIISAMNPYTISFTQSEAGFRTTINERIEFVELNPLTHELAKRLKKDRVIMVGEEVILADTEVKLMNKLHQIYSGTVLFESGKSFCIDYAKANYILKNFAGMKIGIFYKFKAEYELLKGVLENTLTDDLDEFNSADKHIALQIISGREGISLKKADLLVYFNIDFSATSYWQSRDRMTTMDRLENNVVWLFSDGGIEGRIYKAVTRKLDYTISHFRRDFL